MIAHLYPSEEKALHGAGCLTYSMDFETGERLIRFQRRDIYAPPMLTRSQLEAKPEVRKGFRTPPLNPGKRIKSKKRRSR